MIELLFFLFELRIKESTDNYQAINRFNYMGAYQMGGAALVDTGMISRRAWERNGGGNRRSRYQWTGKFGVDSTAEFMNNRHAQDLAIITYHKKLYSQIKNRGYLRLVDRGVVLGGVTLTDSGMVAGAHLVGMGNLIRFVESGGRRIPRDGNNVPITTYMNMFGGFELGFDPSPPATRPDPSEAVQDQDFSPTFLTYLEDQQLPPGRRENFHAYEVATYVPIPSIRAEPFVWNGEGYDYFNQELFNLPLPPVELELTPDFLPGVEPMFAAGTDEVQTELPLTDDLPDQFLEARKGSVTEYAPLELPWADQDLIALLVPAHDEHGNVLPLDLRHPAVTLAAELPLTADAPAQFLETRQGAKTDAAAQALELPWAGQGMLALLVPSDALTADAMPSAFDHPSVTMATEISVPLQEIKWIENLRGFDPSQV